jgi:phosphomevalonate kinase
MSDFCASAPGKLFLSGEYAVLAGAPAVVTTVNRRIAARCTRENQPAMPLTSHVRSEVSAFLQKRYDASPGQLPNLLVETRGFSIERCKLGIGSSAAIVAASTGALFAWAGMSIAAHREDILQVAQTAHYEAQGRRGSGADVAAAVLGGTIVFAPGQPPVSVSPTGVFFCAIWTGASASTVELVKHVQRLAHDNPALHERIFAQLTALATELSDAYSAGDGARIVSLTEAYGAHMQELGEAAGVPIVTAAHAHIRQLAASFQGAAKPSGAGGGDAAIAVFTDQGAADAFSRSATAAGFQRLDFALHTEGLRCCEKAH